MGVVAREGRRGLDQVHQPLKVLCDKPHQVQSHGSVLDPSVFRATELPDSTGVGTGAVGDPREEWSHTRRCYMSRSMKAQDARRADGTPPRLPLGLTFDDPNSGLVVRVEGLPSNCTKDLEQRSLKLFL